MSASDPSHVSEGQPPTWNGDFPSCGRPAASADDAAWPGGPLSEGELAGYLAECRILTIEEIRRIVPDGSPHGPSLYELMLEYPLRSAKALRPAICIATCRALGGRLEPVLPSAAVLELYHNAFLIHDDVEDRSEKRRDEPTLYETWGMPIAVNVGDAMLALALAPLLDNMRLLGMGKALRILQAVAVMARESAEGQATELMWTRECTFDQLDEDYERMVAKKTSYYSFVTPMTIGAVIAGAEPSQIDDLAYFAKVLGVAFQIHDDVLNLDAEEARYGKEIGGDLWEGKHTLILLHALRSARPDEHERARSILRKPRPRRSASHSAEQLGRMEAALTELAAGGELSLAAESRLRGLFEGIRASLTCTEKTADDVAFLLDLVRRHRSVEYARSVALDRAREAASALAAIGAWLRPSVHRSFLEGLVSYVTQRDR
ncbi:polyprenyl synthetase family protein [Sorangium sp. So ce1078]|uniref:polyprenyl synthetase family protein n=1 Tax=Sorangium sp. So ce1078 TaxID=3133329 RepID=UPI003F636CA8